MKNILFIICLFIASACSKPEKIGIYCTDMQYACGDCYPDYRVDSVAAPHSDSHADLVGKEFAIEFSSAKVELFYYDAVGQHSGAFTHYFYGHRSRMVRDKFIVESYRLIPRKRR